MEEEIKELIKKWENKLAHYERPAQNSGKEEAIYVEAKAEVLRAVISDLKALLPKD